MVTLWWNDTDSYEAKEGFHSSQPKFVKLILGMTFYVEETVKFQ